MPDIEVRMSSIIMTRRCLVMSPCLDHGGVCRTVMDVLETRWTGSGVMRNRRLGSLRLRRWTLCAKMMRGARGVDVVDRSQAMVDLWNVIELTGQGTEGSLNQCWICSARLDDEARRGSRVC